MLALYDESRTPPTECIELDVEPRRGWYRPLVELGRRTQSCCGGNGNWLDDSGGEIRDSKLSSDLRGLRIDLGDDMVRARAWRRRAAEA